MAKKILCFSLGVCSFDTFTEVSCKMHLLTLPCLPACLSVQSHVTNSGTNMCTLLQVIHIFEFCLQQYDNKCQTLYIKTQKHFCSNLTHNNRCRENWNTFYARICTSAWPVIMVPLIQRCNWYSTSKHIDWQILEQKHTMMYVPSASCTQHTEPKHTSV